MIFRIYPSKDTFISNARYRGVQQTGSNHGFAESLHVYKRPGVSGSIEASGSELARALLYFPTSSLESFVGLSYSPFREPQFILRLKHETTRDPLPNGYDLEVLAVSGGWDEGRGMDVSSHLDSGVSNWTKRSTSAWWETPGGDTWESPRQTVHLDSGFEDLDVDVTQFFSLWSSGTANDGLMVRVSSSLESDDVYESFYLKSFYSRHSSWPDRRPYVEVRWDDFLGDDRGRMVVGRTGSLFLHNIVGGVYEDLAVPAGELIVRIAGSSGTLMAVTASHVLPGIYSASFVIPLGTQGDTFYDMWGAGPYSYMTGTFTVSHVSPSTVNPSREYIAKVTNIQGSYDPEDVVRFDVLFRRKYFKPSVVTTSSLGMTHEIIERAYYAIENESTRERVVPFGTGSLQHTRLSYDSRGNYFIFPMSNLHSGEVYRIIFLIDRDGRNQLIDPAIKFRVR